MASSSASSSMPRMSFRVFLSFRYEDVRHNFIGHLCKALDHAGIFTYNAIDIEESGMGEDMSITIMKAIEESRVAIIVFSEKYTLSSWCLKVLAKIIECKEQKDLIVLPVFYKVNPGDVTRDASKLGKNLETAKRWKAALYYAGDLFGWRVRRGASKLGKDLETAKRWMMALREARDLLGWRLGYESSEATLIKDIVKTISELISFDVYLSFRSKDVCENFVKSLNEALVHKGINTFMDSDNLRMGHDFPPALMDAMELSRMYIVVFSENYAESPWCLKELMWILERKNRRKKLMLPIFYKVAPGMMRAKNELEEPGTVRAQKEPGKVKSYGEALEKHKVEYGMRKVKKWREALSEAADVNGKHLPDGNEDDWIPRIVEEIEKMIAEIR
ncbi:disease resistance protein RUN1-like [Syzygium oleosum]|uniref:disease resistance protein RUN1-like n=1 Tax=Syzygium oleosum TaxID=219896 RepID=UPI0024BB900C|nr:disease resistance protein RUN1-like [Syzygium oleosum]